MSGIQLTPRLQCVADMVRADTRLADIGTDHAYLPAYLAQRGLIRSAIAADLKTGPLHKAQDTIRSYALEHMVQTRRSNGLEKICSYEADDIVIAGMGGELILNIMTACPWVKDKEKRYILQPMTHSEALRTYLVQNGFTILKESAVSEGRKVYIIINACYTGEMPVHAPSYVYIGEIHDFSNPAAKCYLQQQIRYLSNKLLGGEDKMLELILEELKEIYDNCSEYL